MRELEVYQVLEKAGTLEIAGHNVPQLLSFTPDLLVIEMTIVERPFLLDFAGVKRPEEVPDFEEHVLAEHAERLQELFGTDYPDVIHVADEFTRVTGFVMLDLHPGNVAFR